MVGNKKNNETQRQSCGHFNDVPEDEEREGSEGSAEGLLGLCISTQILALWEKRNRNGGRASYAQFIDNIFFEYTRIVI